MFSLSLSGKWWISLRFLNGSHLIRLPTLIDEMNMFFVRTLTASIWYSPITYDHKSPKSSISINLSSFCLDQQRVYKCSTCRNYPPSIPLLLSTSQACHLWSHVEQPQVRLEVGRKLETTTVVGHVSWGCLANDLARAITRNREKLHPLHNLCIYR